MNLPLKRAGVLLLVLVLCLAVVGVGYGKWSGYLKIRGDMTTATSAIIVGWVEVWNSDPGTEIDDSCQWDFDKNQDIDWKDGGNGKHVGTTTTTLDTLVAICPCGTDLYKRIIVTLDNVYPCYAVKCGMGLRNLGPMPAVITGWTIYPDWGPESGYTWEWNGTKYVSTDFPFGEADKDTRPYNFNFWDGGQMVLDPDCGNEQLFGLVVHVEQPAEQGHTYTFAIEVHAEPAY